MEMEGKRLLAASPQQAWDALNDPEVLKACVPGCERLEPDGEQRYTAAMAVRIGPVAARFSGRIALSDIDPPRGYTLGFDGQGGAAGFGKGSARVALTPRDAGCELSYQVQAQVGGKIAQLGQRLVDGAARSMAEEFFQRFEAQLQARVPAPVAEAPAALEDAAGAPRAGLPAWAWVVGAGLALAVLWWATR